MDVKALILLVWVHWFADFFLQSYKMSINKSKSNWWLGYHVTVYSVVLWIFYGPIFAIINGILHFVTDWISSRINSYLWDKHRIHDFFVCVGVDQALHMTTLVFTYVWLIQ